MSWSIFLSSKLLPVRDVSLCISRRSPAWRNLHKFHAHAWQVVSLFVSWEMDKHRQRIRCCWLRLLLLYSFSSNRDSVRMPCLHDLYSSAIQIEFIIKSLHCYWHTASTSVAKKQKVAKLVSATANSINRFKLWPFPPSRCVVVLFGNSEHVWWNVGMIPLPKYEYRANIKRSCADHDIVSFDAEATILRCAQFDMYIKTKYIHFEQNARSIGAHSFTHVRLGACAPNILVDFLFPIS